MTTTTTTTLPIAIGFDTLDQLCQSMAGRTYAAARIISEERHDYPDAVQFLALVGAATYHDSSHPECYAIEFSDDSLLIRSNASDEVWAAWTDYLEQENCRAWLDENRPEWRDAPLHDALVALLSA
jgi:hypothetical protein